MRKSIVSILALTLLVGCGSKEVHSPEIKKEIEDIKEKPKEITTESKETFGEKSQGIEETDENKEITENIEIEERDTNEKTTKILATDGLSTEKMGWYFNPNNDNIPPTASMKVDLSKYNAHYLGDTNEKVIYLTFDEGYENGYSEKILDILKEKNVKATFFVTKPYIADNQDLIKRMVEEGHIVGNHTNRHKSSPTLSDEEFAKELTSTADYFKEVTGHEMPLVFRPPMGEYNEKNLKVASDLGYKTIFWSFAYKDWLIDQQPGKEVAYNTVMKRYHNGCIMLLHAVSKSNTEALGDIIDSLRAEGYEFGDLEDI